MKVFFILIKKSQYIFLISFFLSISNISHARSTFSLTGNDFASQNNLTSQLTRITQGKYAVGQGSADYRFLIKNDDAGWYELWIGAADWPTNIYLDGALLAHTSLQSRVWPSINKQSKILNLNLSPGTHTIRFEREQFPGLPYIQTISLVPSENISGMVQATTPTQYLVFRKNEVFTLNLLSQSNISSTSIHLNIRDIKSSKIIYKINHSVSSELTKSTINIPTNREGTFDIEFKHPIYGHVCKTIQYVVIDSETKVVNASRSLSKQLIATINPTSTLPHYFSTRPAANENYLESGTSGIYDKNSDPDYFAYRLNLPDSNGHYLVEIDYPDNARRDFTISLVDEMINPYALDSGITTGGLYPLSKQTQTSQLFFYARTKNPRLLFLNWQGGEKIAVNEIRIYKINKPLPALNANFFGRQFGIFFEETLRFTTYFGATEKPREWDEIKKTADRWAEWSNFIGHKVWLQAIANYQSLMWPSKLLPGFSPSEEDGYGLKGQASDKDPMQKDLIRLLLLTAEKNDIAFIGEINLPVIGFLQKALDLKFGGKGGDSIENSVNTPWLTVSNEGEIGGKNGFQPYLNPIHPEVQSWISSLFAEIANRYKDSPAFNGLAMRLMSWSFSSWQAFPSIYWGYDDFTIGMFEKETGISVPNASGSTRFQVRFEWLTSNKYNEWVNWRCKKISAFHLHLATILKNARPDLKLYIDTFGPDFSPSDWGKHGGWRQRAKKINNLGWLNVIKESGIDPNAYKNSPDIVFTNFSTYPSGAKTTGAERIEREHLETKETDDSTPLLASAKNGKYGINNSVGFINNYMEYDFPLINLGFDRSDQKNKTMRICGKLEPSGKSLLKRYLKAMANGNITFMIDGGLGYIIGQPLIMRPFLQEYYSLPKIEMQSVNLKNSEISSWQGRLNDEFYYYIVNPTNEKIDIKLNFTLKNTTSAKLTSGDLITDKLTLESNSLSTFKINTKGSQLKDLEIIKTY